MLKYVQCLSFDFYSSSKALIALMFTISTVSILLYTHTTQQSLNNLYFQKTVHTLGSVYYIICR